MPRSYDESAMPGEPGRLDDLPGADFAVAVSRGLDDLRRLDEVGDVGAEGLLPPPGR